MALSSNEFKHHYGSVHAYLEHYVKTATWGNVKIEYALHIARMRLVCTKCDMTLTCAESEGTTVDYGVQEFVKIHAHTGGHKDVKVDAGLGKVIPMTADFKPVAGGFGYVPLPPSANMTIEKQPPYVTWEKQTGTYGTTSQPVKVKKKDKPLKIATGRKFR